ncbi:MAG TPA: NAD(P)/FAD-dependent oxidoreductase, partial [Kofleriaceae bacterium]|nr:NAD(P)/FAD-dependent oxidoreductase [Kofleriaceae bacterium]
MSSLRVGVIGCGSAGPAVAALLAHQGHRVTLFERVSALGAVGAGFLLQPTGLSVLGALGILEPILDHGAPVDRLHCRTRGGLTLLDLRYGELRDGLYGIGMHRAVLLHHLVEAARAAGVDLRLDCDVDQVSSDGEHAYVVCARGGYGPFDLVAVADGARSALRDGAAPRHKVVPYPWGALWHMGTDGDGRFAGQLSQVVDGARTMLGFLPTGRPLGGGPPLVSMFWSTEVANADRLRRTPLADWKQRVRALEPRAAPLLAGIDAWRDLTLAAYLDVRMRPWHRGRIVFLGDAAHATSPQLGQGVNLALCDAAELAARLAGGIPVPAALAAYSAARRRHLAY